MFTYIKLKNYCSLVDFQVNFMGKRDNPKKLILIYGENGVGKSNLATAFFTLYETLRTMSIKDMLEKLRESVSDEEFDDSSFQKFMKQNLKDIESIIKSSKTINSQDSMLLEFGFKLNGKKGVYRIETDNTHIISEHLDFVLNKNKTDELYVVGKIEELEALKDHPQVTLIDAREIFEMTENILAIRRKKESSLVKAMMLARNNEVDAVLSCGNTGAYYACAMLFLKRIKGIEKSCLMATIPTLNDKGVCMLDVGANAENTVDQLVQFAIMGNVYAKNVRHIQKPKVALLNIGSEEHKGDEIHKETYQSLSTLEQIDFVGNIEGKEILRGDVDVIVTDGFTGNVTLKTIEGVALSMMSALKDGFMASTRNKLGAVISKPVLKGLKTKFDPAGVGGALMMGFVKPVVKAHGASDAKAFESAMNLAFEMVEVNVVEKMKVGLDESGIR